MFTVLTIFLSKVELIMLQLGIKKYKNAELEVEMIKELVFE